MKRLWASAFALISILVLAGAQGQAAERRVALVIGNQAYESVGELSQTRADASEFGAALQRLGFEVTLLHDAGRREMDQALQAFRRNLRGADVALLYYSGHGMEVDGANYLAPTTARLTDRRSLEREMIALNDVIEIVESGGARFNMIVLDACRNNPFTEQMSAGMRGLSGGVGLAPVTAPEGTVIAFATAPGELAWEGGEDFDNSLFTEALLQWMEEPGLELTQVLRNARQTVAQWSGGEQIPWESSAMIGDFYFTQVGAGAGDQPPLVAQAAGDDAGGLFNPREGQAGGGMLQPGPGGGQTFDRGALWTIEPTVIAGILDEMGLAYSLSRDDYGGPLIVVDSARVAADAFEIWFYDCDAQDSCDSSQLTAWYGAAHPVKMSVANEWNATQRWAVAAITKSGPVLRLDINGIGGVGRDQIADAMYVFMQQMDDFVAYVQ